MFSAHVTIPSSAALGKAEQALMSVLEGLPTMPPSRSEMERLRHKVVRERAEAVGTAASTARLLAISAATSGSPLTLYEEYDAQAKLNVDEVVDVADRFLRAENRWTLVYSNHSDASAESGMA